MVEIKSLTVLYPGAKNPAAQQLDMSIPAGQITLLIGGNYSGKSTVLGCMSGLIPTIQQAKVDGYCQLQAKPGVLLQNSDIFLMEKVVAELEFPLQNHGWSKKDRQVRIQELADMFQLNCLLERKMYSLSGGERQRVALAAAIAGGQQLLLLDEPLAQLDPSFSIRCLEIFSQLAATGTTILIATTASYLYQDLNPVIYWLNQGKLYWQGDYADFTGYWHEARNQGIDVAGNGNRLAADKVADYHHNKILKNQPILKMNQIRFSYQNKLLLEQLNLTVQAGEIVAITGPNGVGKTTLLKLAANIIRPDSGEIFVLGRNLKGLSIAAATTNTGVLFQNPDHQISQEQVRKEIAWGLKLRQLDKQLIEERVDKWLDKLGLTELADMHPYSLTKTERQWIALASILVQEPALLLLDEPTHGLDCLATARLMQVVEELAKEGTGVLLVTHHLGLARSYAHQVIEL